LINISATECECRISFTDFFSRRLELEVVLLGMEIGLTFALSLNKKHSLRFTALSRLRFEQDGDFIFLEYPISIDETNSSSLQITCLSAKTLICQ
jgi:hypothetical protein